MSTPITSCVNDFVPVEFTPESGLQTDYYCDRKNERYIRVSGISDEVCNRLLDMRSDNEVELYVYDEYTEPLCNKGDNALIFAFADTGFPALPCESIDDCPPDFFGICHETDKMCLKCPEEQMPNTARNQCVDLQCDEETETMCDNGEAKWCCPNTEICSTTPGECIQSDGMCSYFFLEPTVTKTYDCAYTFNEPVVTKTYDCAYRLTSKTRADGTETIGLESVKSCANSSLYCNLQYGDEACGKTAPADTPVGGIIYGTCAPPNTSNKGCTADVNKKGVLTVQKPCANPSLYCNLQYGDESCGKTAPSDTVGKTIYGTCAPPNTSNKGCTADVNKKGVLTVKQPCPSNQYCHLRYADEQCTAASADAVGVIYGVCLTPDSSSAVCPVPQK